MHLHPCNAFTKFGVLAAAIMTAGAGLALTATGANAATSTAASARLAHAAPASPRLGGVFTAIKNFSTGKCLEPASTADAALIIEAPCVTTGTESIAQGWEHIQTGTNHFRFENQLTGECFDAFDGAFNGARLIQGTCKAISNEEYNTGTSLPATTKIEARVGFRDTGFCLDVSSNLTNVLFFQCNGTQSQAWSIGF